MGSCGGLGSDGQLQHERRSLRASSLDDQGAFRLGIGVTPGMDDDAGRQQADLDEAAGVEAVIGPGYGEPRDIRVRYGEGCVPRVRPPEKAGLGGKPDRHRRGGNQIRCTSGGARTTMWFRSLGPGVRSTGRNSTAGGLLTGNWAQATTRVTP